MEDADVVLLLQGFMEDLPYVNFIRNELRHQSYLVNEALVGNELKLTHVIEQRRGCNSSISSSTVFLHRGFPRGLRGSPSMLLLRGFFI